MLIKKIKYSLVFLLVISNFNFAQNRDYSFLHLNKSLSQNTITTIFEDHLGFIWIGTAHGLNRYDGMEVLIFENHSEDSSSISDNYIRKIVEDKNGDLWIATVNGLNKYDRAQNIFVRYFNEPGNYRSLASNNVSDVWVDSKSRIWVSAESLCLFDAGKNEFVRFEAPTESSNLTRDPYHNFIYEDNGQNIWYGYWSDLFKFNENKQRLEVVLGGSKNNFGEPGWHYHEMIQDSQNSYWLATNRGGLIKLEMNSDEYVAQRFNDKITNNSKLSDYRILTVFIDHRNELWVSCENAGLFLFDVNRKLKKHFVSKPGESTSISGNSIWTIFEDRSNRLWFGSWNVGIDLIDPLNIKFAHYNSYGIKSRLSHNIATDFLEDEAGNLWIATDGGGINYFNRESDEFTYYQNNLNGRFELSSDAVLCLTYDNRGRIWAGTWNGGINILDLKSGKAEILNTTNSGLTSNDIFDLLYDGKEKIYIATYRGGLNIFNLRSGKVENYLPLEGDFNSISSSNLFVLYQDSEESIWIGSLGEGLNKLVEDEQGEISFLRYQYFENIDNGLSDNGIHNIYEDSNGRFWISTSDGLNLMNRKNGTFQVFDEAAGFLTSYISAVEEDSSGALWVSSLKGLTRFSADLQNFQHYDETDNLQGYNFNRNSAYKTSGGELIFGGSNGFNIFDPTKIVSNPNPPDIVFTDLKISNKSVPIGMQNVIDKHISIADEINLRYDHSVFSIEFVAFNYTHPEKNQYAYMMEGFDNEWINSGTQRNATYTNLDANSYTFKVKAANNDGVWNEDGISIPVIIHPPFWATWWAYLSYVLAAVGIFYLIMSYNLRQQKLKHDLELEHIKLEKLSELDKIKSRFFSNVSHEIRTPIMLIVGPLENLLRSSNLDEKVKSKLSLITRNAERLSRMLNQLIDFYSVESPKLNLNLTKSDLVNFVRNVFDSFREYANDHQINFIFNLNVNVAQTWFDKDVLDKLLYNLLSNAFKFTKDGGEVELGLNFVKSESKLQNHVAISVRDSGIGIPPEQREKIFERFYQIGNDDTAPTAGIGIGLHMTHELVELHQGKITVDSEVGKGTIFKVVLPVDVIEPEDLENTESNEPSFLPEQVDLIEEKFESAFGNGSVPLILMVEDEPDVLQYIKDIFDENFQVVTANNGEEGFQKAMELIPDLIISDIKMPVMDGYGLCRKLKEEEETSHIPIILLTAHTAAEHKLKGIKLGATAFVPKPFNSEELIARVHYLLDAQRKLRESYKKQLLLEPKDSKMLSLDEKFLIRVRLEVENNISDWKLDAESLSEKVGVSRIQLYRKIKSLTGQTVHEFIRSIRLRRAIQLLDQRKMKVTEIAYEVGFKDLNYFSRCFRKEYDHSPSEYLSSLKENTEIG